jgi:pimeloyl-ACP methyl ester carboxylesterase
MPTAAGLHYFFHEGGSVLKPPLLFIHGAGGDYLSWPAEIRRFQGARSFSLDLPGHGRTEGPGRQTVEDYATSLVAFMDVIGVSKFVLVGHALGGAVALSLALNHPERVAGLVLISTGPRLPVPPSILENAANPSTLPLAVKSLQEMYFGSLAPSSLKETASKQLASTRQTLLLGDLRACDRFDLTGRLDAVRVPTLVVCGTEDKLTPIHFSETLAGQIPGAALQTMDGTGHLLMLEQPQRLVKLISLFLETVPYMPGA